MHKKYIQGNTLSNKLEGLFCFKSLFLVAFLLSHCIFAKEQNNLAIGLFTFTFNNLVFSKSLDLLISFFFLFRLLGINFSLCITYSHFGLLQW